MSGTPSRRVLAGFAESLAAPEVVGSLRDAEFDVSIFTRSGASPPMAKMKRRPTIYQIATPEEDAPRAIDHLNGLTAGFDAVLPLDDASIWLCDRLEGVGCVCAGPVGDDARLALDKRIQLDRARKAGLAVPETSVLDGPAQLGSIETFPVVVKGALAARQHDGRLKRDGGAVAGNLSELETAAERFDADAPLLVQPLIDGVGEGVFGLATDTGIIAWSGYRRVRMMNPQGSGSSACRSIGVSDELKEQISAMLVGWRGMFMIELLRDASGTPWFMELNGRAWGSMALARRRGLEYAAWHIEQALGERPIARDAAPGEVLCRNLGREIAHVLQVMRGPRSGAITNWPGRGRTLIDVLRPTRDTFWYNRRRGEYRFFLADAWATVRSQVFKGR